MRTVSLKSLCLLAGFLVPCLGSTSKAEAGIIPWLYNSIFGYGWGNYYGPGYGGGSPYTVGYGSMGGYGGYGYGAAYYPSYAPSYSSYGYGAAAGSCGCSSGISSAPVMSSPTYAVPTPAPANSGEPKKDDAPPADGNYKLEYQPSAAYYDYYTGYAPAYVVDSGSCCAPCVNCAGGDCATPAKSSKPAVEPTPADAAPKKKGPPSDEFGPTKSGTGSGQTGIDTNGGGEALPETELRPANRPENLEGVGTEGLKAPKTDEVDPAIKENRSVDPINRSIAVRYNPALKRSAVAVPRSASRLVRVDRSTRTQTAQSTVPQSQLAAKP